MTLEDTHNLSVGHCNIQGGLTSISKSTEITQLIRKHELDVLSLNEINLGESVDSSTINIPSSFDFIRKDRENSARGGCALLVNKKVAYKVVEFGPEIKTIEAIWIKVKSSNIYICGFYRSNNYCHIDTFIEYINTCMKKLRGKRVMWIGDVNIDQNNITDSKYRKLDLALKTFNLKQTIQGITRFHRHGQHYTTTTIDVIFTNFYSDFTSCNVLDERIGDHQAIKCEIDFAVKKAPKYEKVVIRNHSMANIAAFKQYLNSESSAVDEILNMDNVEEAANSLNEVINGNYDHFFPLKTISVHEKFIHKPSKELLDAIKHKKKLYNVFRKCLERVEKQKNSCNRCMTCSICLKCNEAWESFKSQRNLVTKLKKFNKRQNVIKDLKVKSSCNDLKGIWKTIKLASNMAPSGNPQNNLKPCNIEPTELNEHFCKVGYNLQSQIPIHENAGFADFMTPAPDNVQFSEYIPVLKSNVENYITSLTSNKAVFDQVPLKIFKAIMPCILEPLTHIINLSLSTGEVPSCCKTARITPILKSGDGEDPNNYRPISILPIISKCIEYHVSIQLKDYIESNNILCSQQYGFRENHSTTYLMLDLIDEVYKSKSSGQIPAIIFLDIKKAFDTVNHEILIEKLRHYGINGTVLHWFINYLTGRYQCTKMGNSISTFLLVLCGVPQGSLLGPILFSIYINDLQNACKLSTPFLFADDGALFFQDICRKSYMNMQIELLIISKWLDVNKLSLNIEKTEYMVFDHNLEKEFILVNDNILIYECKVTKYLGLMIDHKLSFTEHVDYIMTKVSKRINAMYKSKNLLPLKYRKMFANALVLPVFDYLDVIYSRACKTKLSDLDVLYKKVAKIALDVPVQESSISVYKDMGWLPLHLRRQLHLSSFMFRIIKGNCPANFDNKFKYLSGGSRDASNCNLYTPKSKTHKEFAYLGTTCWNILPHELRDLDDIKTFNRALKTQLLFSATNDENYSSNNSYDHVYKPISATAASMNSTNMPHHIREVLESIQS